MTLTVGVDPQTASLLTAIGVLDDDGQLVSTWFEDPLAAIRRVLSNPVQRAALLRLLDELLPTDPGQAGWYPLLDTEVGNLYLTVENDVVGIAAALHSGDLGDGVGQVRGTVRLPLVSVADELEAIAVTAEGPLLVGVDVGFTSPDIPLSRIGAAVGVYADDAAPLGVQAAVRVTIDDVNLGGGDPVDLVIDSATMGRDLLRALRLLLGEVIDLLVAEAGDNDQLARLGEHLFALLGLDLDGDVPPLPLEELFARPEAALDWLVDVVDSPDTLTAWATHLAGLIGDDLEVVGTGETGQPFRARLVDSDVLDLFLVLEATADRHLVVGVDARVDAGPVALSAAATVLRIPLPAPGADPAAPARFTQLVPDVTVGLVAPTSGLLVDNAPVLQVGSLGAGFRLADGVLTPWLEARGVVIDGQDHGTVDLTDADAVVGVVGDAARGILEDALGDSPAARALLTLVGLRRPDTDPTTPHLLDPAALGRGPTAALAGLHREILADAAHPWQHMLAQVALLAGLTPDIGGAGTVDDPWTAPIATEGPVTLALAAWNARTDADPAGLQRLRLGVLAQATQGVFDGRLLVELLAFDLPAAGHGAVALVGRSELRLRVTPDGPMTLDGLALESGLLSARAEWRPGEAPVWQVGVAGVTVTVDDTAFGAFDLTLPRPLDDLGLGDDAIRLLGQLISSALRSWSGEPAYALAALLGLHRDLPDLPADWPLLSDLLTGAGSLRRLLDDPPAALRAHLRRLLTGVADGGRAFVVEALRVLRSLLPGELSTALAITGSGRYDDPWVVPIVDETADPSEGVTSVDALVWLDPAGPPAEWIALIAQAADEVSDGDLLARFLAEAAAFRPQLAASLRGRAPDAVAFGFDELAEWLSDSDGLVPLASQLPDGWEHGATVATPHALLPKDPAVISQVVTRLVGAAPILLVAPPFADHAIYDDLVLALTGAAPSLAHHFDLRALPDPAEVDLTRITAVTRVYTADLTADHAVSQTDQLRAVAQRIRALTGQAPRVVGHSTAGVVARALAAAQPDVVAGLITIGSPHAGSDLLPLADQLTADAVRVAAAVAGAVADSALGGTVGWLAGLLDGSGGGWGGPVRPGWFAGAELGLVDAVPRFAIGSRLGGDLPGLLAGSTVVGLAGGAPPTHLGFGVRLGLATPEAEDDDGVVFAADARVDLARLRLTPDAAEPPRPATAVTISTTTSRPDGWLVGDGMLAEGPLGARVRRVEAGVTVTAGPEIRPWLRLVDASIDATPVRDVVALGDEALRAALDAVVAELSAADDPAADAALNLLEAAGALVATADGRRASVQGILALATAPTRTLTERRAALIAALRAIVGDPDLTDIDLGGLDPGALSVSLPELPLRLSLDDATMTIRLETTPAIELAGPFLLAGRLDLDTRTLAVTLDASLAAGPVTVRRSADGTVTATASPYLAEPMVLRPFDPPRLAAQLEQLIPDLAVSAVVAAVLDESAESGITVGPISALVRDPVGWLRDASGLVTPEGLLDGDRINDLLRSIGDALGLDDSQGLALPGGMLLTASGTDPLHLQLSGTLGDDVVGAAVDLGLDLRRTGPLPTDVRVTPSGTIALTLALPGDWGTLGIAFGADAAGVRLVVTPEHVGPIQLLPTVSGLGDLLSTTATALVPRVLQEITDALAASPPHPVLDVALDVAEALGIYDPAAGGFIGAAQAERVRHMLDPGWLEDQVTDPALLIGHLQRLFPDDATPGPIVLPPGHRVRREGDRLRWEMDLPGGGLLGAELGWGAAGHPQVLVTLADLDAGPLTIDAARLGYLDALEGLLRVRVDAGEPLDWFTPEAEFALAGDRVRLRILPLGAAAEDDVAIVLAPVPDLVLTPEGGLQLAASWLLPLITRYVIPQVEALLDQPLWPSGPTSRRILHGARLLTSPDGELRIAVPFPEPAVMGLGTLKAALSGVAVELTDGLALAFAEDAGRLGIRLRGAVRFPGDVSVSLLFGEHEWIGESRGITAWVIGPSDDPALPVAPAPALDVSGLGLRISGADDDHPLFGADDGVVRLGGIAALFFGRFDFWDPTARRPRFAVDRLGGAVELTKAAVRVNGSDGDSFVAKLIPQELGAGFTMAVAYHDDRLQVYGGPGNLDNGIELTFPLNLNIFDVVLLRELYLAALFGDPTTVTAALSGNAELGPIAVTVDRVGLRVTISGSGAVLSFKPPDGAGFSLDTSTIRLGGFLLVDEARGRYVGALEIALLEKFSLTAIGIVTTKNADGTPGFSLLMLITVSLPVPIPLGYGFFFSGAGGLLGLNRGMDVDRIRDGLRTGTADSILFPTDVVNRIDVIIRDLEESFPVQEGHFLIAPMGMITWMNPALVTLKIGLILEIAPQPNVALLGVLRLALPTPSEAVVDLKVAFIGGIDIGAGLLYFDASIYDSFIGYGDFKLSLEGDIAVRFCWGAKPDLVISVGGFHPGYSPAAHLKLPAMRRLTLSLLKDNPRLTLTLYFAITSNTIQFGARLEFFAGIDGFSISGDFGFDVLVQFVPFLIDACMWGKLAITAAGCDICSIDLRLQLRGPTPWYAHGTASFRILFFSITIEVEATFGDAHEASIPAEPVLPRLLDQLRDPSNWSAELASSSAAGVALLPPPQGALVVDAAGLLSVRQNLLPLETDIGLVGKTPPSDVRRVAITGFSLGTVDPEPVAFDDVTAPFSPSTFAGASNTNPDLLKAPAFEQRPHGVRAGSGQSLAADLVLHHPQSYEMIVIDDPDPEAPTPPPVSVNPRLNFSHLVAGGAIAASASSKLRARRDERGAVRTAVVAEPLFAVTAKDSLLPLGPDGLPATAETMLLSRTDAEQRLAALPADGRQFQIVPEVQVVL
ncbi:alpha/beta hydrolase [Tessaracoccus caeni]|uniref:alpha/beta hydrolase n=1 Tax=Tessaracoccus caeni TaxID=3031239 RepID=UPI0023DBB915|nr:alpha/beta hydrolase [Tessaracoccus caeni]MDF1489003.1 alpha/beta hydrolase [Tessaracoccus caeni]